MISLLGSEKRRGRDKLRAKSMREAGRTAPNPYSPSLTVKVNKVCH